MTGGLFRQIFIIWLYFYVHRETDAVPACKMSEFPCKNNQCVRLDRFCNGVNDCGDKSDEPSHCTTCNRTFYGELGITYDMELPKPRPERVPFLCHLTFTASGRTSGDIIQLLFDTFQVGRFDERSYDGCPDGYMQIMELGRPFTGGSWCGASQGLTVYYSETSTITVTIRLHHSLAVNGFQFKIRYRFLSDDEAVVRFGTVSSPFERGEVVPGTYCSRNFYECYRKRCKLQSPNFPGMYPRNVTCHFSLKQKELPTCKHAMISVSQKNSQHIQLKRSVSIASINKTKSIRTWADCSGSRDYLTFYDGPSTDDPVLVKFCGGDWLPPVLSRGPEMLVVFHSSTFSTPLNEVSPYGLRGFELDIHVVFVDSDSMEFSRESRRCEFLINASSPDGDEISLRSKGRAGFLLSPAHSLPPNTTCVWQFRGQATDLIWLYFLRYSSRPLIPEATANVSKIMKLAGKRLLGNSTKLCSTRLRIWDGGGKSLSQLLGDHCSENSPKLCDHTSLGNLTRTVRPCGHLESYRSSGNQLLIKLTTEEGTVLHPVSFKLWYEFVDTRLGGDPLPISRYETQPSPCNRIFRRQRKGLIYSPRNIFLYGRGGATNLSCVYRIEASPFERVKLTLINASLGDGQCTTVADPHTERPRCIRSNQSRIIELSVFESPWREVVLPHACFCDNSSFPAFQLVSVSRALELHFVISEFNITEDYTNLYFHAEFEVVRKEECPRRKVTGSGGEIVFSEADDDFCRSVPWWVEARQNSSLFLLTWGVVLSAEPTSDELEKCSTRNRIIVYSGYPLKLQKVICPSKANTRPYAVHIFSEEWLTTSQVLQEERESLPPQRSPYFLLEFVRFEPGTAQVNWLEISRLRSSQLFALHMDLPLTRNGSFVSEECIAKCPEIDACISPLLWCDGHLNCPSGYDEAESHCGVGHRFISLIPGGLYAVLGAAAAVLTFFCLFIALIVAYHVRKRISKGYEGGRLYHNNVPKRVPTDELLLDIGSTSSS